MLLAIDIGNTNIVIGCIEDDRIVCEARIATDRSRTSDQYGVEIKTMLEAYGCRIENVEDCIISSVVPPVFNAVRSGVYKVTERKPMVVGHGLKTGLDIRLDNPSQVGSDRIVVAVAALAKRKAPLILIDMGTATTVEVIEPKNRYLGGVIMPGARTALDALTRSTAQLPAINMDKPGAIIARNTVDSMRSGIMYGTAAMLDGVLDRMEDELGHPSTIIATGGVAPYIIPLCRHRITLERDLLLRGLNVIYKMNKSDKT
ncbi:MAG: type III pantothenate kinase [Oscillospiraceae bacterium]|nr:type III pantothenate kinase [Oscillospiraceae bacterium]